MAHGCLGESRQFGALARDRAARACLDIPARLVNRRVVLPMLYFVR